MSRQLAPAAPVAEVAAAPAAAQPASRRLRAVSPEGAMQSSALAIGAFAGLPAGNITDADAPRALATRLLLEQLAPALGLDLSRIRIRCDAASAARLDGAGARGLQEGASILLHPSRYRPESGEGRALLAHEAAHAAQRLLEGPADEAAAEREAVAIGEAVRHGRTPPRPQVALRTLGAAADAGADKPPAPTLGVEMVKVSRAREIAAIEDALSGAWVSDGDVFKVLAILETVPHAVIKPLLQALSEPDRYALADNINPPHVHRNRRTALACYEETLPDELLRRAVDLEALQALPLYGMTVVEQESAFWVLAHLSDGQREELRRSGSGAAIDRILMAPKPTAAEQKTIADDAGKAAKDEAQLRDSVDAARAYAKSGAGAADLARLKTLLTERPSAATAREALATLGGGGVGTARFHYLAEQLEQADLIDTLVKLLPTDILFSSPGDSAVLFALVRSRMPSKNEKTIEGLLSYGVFDWSITEADALFAYRLIKSLPLSAQHRFRMRDGGEWYLRLLDNLPTDPSTQRGYPGIEIRRAETKEELDELRKSGATEIDEEAQLYNASELHEKKLREKGATAHLADLVAAFEEAEGGIFTDKEATDLYRRLVALGRSELAGEVDRPADRLLREAVVHELDRLGHIDRLFDNVPESVLYDEANRVSTVEIMLARDPSRAARHARELVSRSATDWMVSDGEAWLAYQCVKALPTAEREAFIADRAEEWGRILGEMSREQRQASDLNLYVGDKAGVDRASVLGQLAVGETWSEANAGMLANLVRMAIAMTEHRFAFERSKAFRAIEKPKLAPVVEKFRLWDPVRRPEYSAKALQGTRWHEEGVFATLRQVWGGLVTIANMDVLLVSGGGLGLRADLGDVQEALGGDLFGARVADPSKRGADQPLPHPEANKISLVIGADGSAEVRLPELELDGGNIQMGGSTLQFGRLVLGGLRLRAGFEGGNYREPSRASAEIGSVRAEDLLLAKSSSMLAIGRLLVGSLRAAAATVDAISPPGVASGGRQISLPFLLFVPHLLGLLAVAALPAYLYSKITGLLGQGLQKGMADQFAGDAAERAKSISFSLGTLEVENLSTSGGQTIGHVAVRDFSVQVGLNRAAGLRAEQASLEARIAALAAKPGADGAGDDLRKRLAEVVAELERVRGEEREYLEIMRQIRAGGLTPEKQKALQARLDALRFEDGAKVFIDIGSIEAAGLEGTVTAKEPVRMSGIHGEGGGDALSAMIAMPVMTDAEMSRRSAAGLRPEAPLGVGGNGGFRLELGDIHTGELSIGSRLRTAADIEAEIARLEPLSDQEALKPLYESLLLLLPKARRYERLAQHGVSRLDAAQLAEFGALRKELAAKADVIVRSIDIVKARLDADLATGAAGFGADSVRIAGIQMPAKGIDVDEVIVRGLGVRAVPKGGLLGFTDWKANLEDAGAGFETMEVSGARSRYHGLLFEKATLTGAYADLRERGNHVELGLAKLTVKNVGLAPRLGLLQQKLDGLRAQAQHAPADEKPALEKQVRELEARVADLQRLVDARLAAYAALESARTPEEKEAAKKKVADVDATIVVGLAQYGASEVTLDEFGVSVSGAGDVLGDALGASGVDPLALLKRGGVTVQGTGPDKRLFKGFSVRGGQMASHAPGQKGASQSGAAGSFEIGETKLDVAARYDGASIVVDVADIAIASIGIDRFDLTSAEAGGGIQLWSDGKSAIEGLRFKGSVRLDPKVERPAGLGDYRPGHVKVDSFRVDAFAGTGLGFALPGQKFEIAIKSGAIRGIHAEGLDVTLPANADASPVVTGKAGIEAIDDLVIGRAVAGAWQVGGGKLSARKLDAAFLEDGGIEASVGSLSLLGASVRGPDGWARFSLADLGGKVHYKDGVLDVPDLHLGSFEVAAVHWRAGAKGLVEADQPLVLKDVRLRARVEMAQPGEDGKQPANPIRRLKLHKLHVGGFEAKHLIFRNEDYRIEIGGDDAARPKYMRGVRGIELKDLDIWDLEWTPGEGVTTGAASLASYGGMAAVEGLKSGLKAGVALHGANMSASVMGPGLLDLNIGQVDKFAGFYGDGKLNTKFAAGAIGGSVTFGPDFIEARDFEMDNLEIGKTTYTDGPRSLELHHARVDKIKVGKVRQDYALTGDAGAPKEKVAGKLTVSDVEFLDARTGKFAYDGSSTSTTCDGKEVTSTQHIEARRAVMKRLVLGTITHDPATATTILSNFKVDAGDKPERWERPFSISGLAATFVNGIGDKPTTTKLITNVKAGPLTGEEIKLETIEVGKEKGPDGVERPITGTRITGGFDLDRLGLHDTKVSVTDSAGKTTVSAGVEAVQVAGLKPRFLPNGVAYVPFDELAASNIKVTAGPLNVSVQFAAVRNVAASLSGLQPGQAFEILGAKLAEMETEGLGVTYEIDRSAPGTPGAAPSAPELWVLEPIKGLSGTLNVHIDQLAGIDLPVPVSNGVIDFDDLEAEVDWVPGDAELFITRRRVWAEHAVPIDIHNSPTDIPGVTDAVIEVTEPIDPEDVPGRIVRSHGSINLHDFLEGTLNAAPAATATAPAERLSETLNTISINGTLRTNDGKIGKGANNVDLSGAASGKNAITISAARLGEHMRIGLPDIQASKGHFNLAGKAIETGQITAKAAINIHGLSSPADSAGHFKFTITLDIVNGTVADVHFGDVTLTTLAGAKGFTGALPAAVPPGGGGPCK